MMKSKAQNDLQVSSPAADLLHSHTRAAFFVLLIFPMQRILITSYRGLSCNEHKGFFFTLVARLVS
jgi:hypothetical protein